MVVTQFAAVSRNGRWLWRADCGHYLVPRPCCADEPNPPMAYCEACDDEVGFAGLRLDMDGTITVGDFSLMAYR